VAAVNVAAHIDDAVIFLDLFLGHSPWPLVAIKPGDPGASDIHAYAIRNSPQRKEMATEWIGRHNREGYNVYFAPNPLNRLLHRKATKDDVASANWLWADLDPPKNATQEEIEAWRTEMRQQLREPLPCGLPAPTWINDSGRGFWIFWHLRTPLPVDGKDGRLTAEIEAYGTAIEQAFAPWTDNCRNIDRIARLPGTINHKTGWRAGVVDHNPDAAYGLEDFPPPPEPAKHSSDPKAQSTAPPEEPCPEAELPEDLLTLTRDGVPEGERSEQFHHVVCWLHDLGWDVAQIEELLGRYPDGIATKYWDRLAEEIARCFGKARPKADADEEARPKPEEEEEEEAGPQQGAKPADNPYQVHWHGEPDDCPMREWLVEKTLPRVGTGLLSGQWGTYKTFVAMHLSACVMAKLPFAGRDVHRQGGVLLVAVEGQDEIKIRLQAVIEDKVAPTLDDKPEHFAPLDIQHMPYAWIPDCPKLAAPDAFKKLSAVIQPISEAMKERFGLPLALVIIDTLSPAAQFKDADSTSENQQVMSVLRKVARALGCFVLAVDHFGKDVSTGTRNSSVKESDADAVLALLGERDLAGNVSNPRMAIRKVRAAPTGEEIRFQKRLVNVVDKYAFSSTLVIDFADGSRPAQAPGRQNRWSKSLTIFKRALETCLAESGTQLRPFADGPMVTAVARERVRDEFFKSYPADSPKAKAEAFRRNEREAVTRSLMASREIGHEQMFWLVDEGSKS
jgi:hypothetical protein